jgi:hypothetical protein
MSRSSKLLPSWTQPSCVHATALHLATVMSLGEDLERLYCYDGRLGDAAAALGIEVSQPH